MDAIPRIENSPMPGTKRTPIHRSPLPQITPVAVRLFEAMKRCRCTCNPDPEVFDDCRGCQKWWRLHNGLHDELGCRPWQWPCVEDPNVPVDDPDTPADWQPDLEAQALWNALEAAAREARRAARRAKADTAPAAPPEQNLDRMTPIRGRG
jgi:hypothetical protein